jgi:8-oxo-dGTP pyrophosphatase MutT (NUDIX family)
MKVIAETPYFDFVQFAGQSGLHIKIPSVAVLPYTVDENGIVNQIGILREQNQLREGGFAKTLITGSIEVSDEDTLATAVRELYEEGGFNMNGGPVDKWTYLGGFHDSKDSDRIIPTFAVDVTGVEQEPAQGDGTPQEQNSKLEMVDVNVALQTNELLVLGSFLRLFNIMYQKSFKNAK